MKRSTKWFLALVAVVALMGAAVVGVAVLTFSGTATAKGGSVLRVRLEGAWPDHDPNARVNAVLGRRVITLHDLIAGIDAAREDDRILALEARIGLLDIGWAKARELRDALVRFRASGKPFHAFLEYGNDGTYYVASAADEIRMIETGTLWVDGIRAEVPFYAGTLGKIGVTADIEQIGRYKNAADSMKRESMSAAHREAVAGLLEGLFSELVAELSASLDAEPAAIDELISSGPYTGQEALDVGLIDALAYEDEAGEALDEVLAVHAPPRLALGDYLQTVAPPHGREAIAIVHCEGAILPGRSTESLFGDSSMGSDTIAAAIRQAYEEDDAAAIVLRVNSPGGSPVASDVIWRAVMRARENGVPVVVSMSDVAASGGYWISMGADRVLAEPSTITGSIGIYGGKYVTSGLNELIAMHVEPVERGDNAGINSSLEPFTDSQREWVREQLGSVYRAFLQKTAEGRGFASTEDVDAHAQGRVWTGRQALEIGLVDELGGLREAIDAARELAGLRSAEPVTLRRYPKPAGFFEALFGGESTSILVGSARRELRRQAASELPDDVWGWLAGGRLLRQLQEEGVLAYMPYRVRAR